MLDCAVFDDILSAIFPSYLNDCCLSDWERLTQPPEFFIQWFLCNFGADQDAMSFFRFSEDALRAA